MVYGQKKIVSLKEYVAKQATIESFWFLAETASEAYLQKELRKMAWLIEEATTKEVMQATEALRNPL